MQEESYTFRTFHISPHMLNSIKRYIQHGCPPGSFLTAIIENNLKSSVMYADDDNINNLPAYVEYFYNRAPILCWGYEGVINEWKKYLKEEKDSE